MKNLSALQKARYAYETKLPSLFYKDLSKIAIKTGDKTKAKSDEEELKEIFPNTYGMPKVTFEETGSINSDTLKERKIGVILSGGQAPGGHNVISGLFDALKRANEKSTLIGFLNGPEGIIKGNYKELTKDIIDEYRNTGGFDIIGSGRTKIERDDQIKATIENARKLDLDALVIIGGDDSNTNAAFLAKHFIKNGLKTKVIGVPKTIDGDIKSEEVEITFGFDTATKTYANEIGNIERDTISAGKYWQFIKLMGRSASHITLECALKTHPNITLISEEIAQKKLSLKEIVQSICNVIKIRADKGMNYGVILIPEGVIEFIPEMQHLITELNDMIADYPPVFNSMATYETKKKVLKSMMSKESFETLDTIPDSIAAEFLGQRDQHGNVQVSFIDTENLFAILVKNRLEEMQKEGSYKGKFSSQLHFFGFEGRSVPPSNFDANYCYSLGYTAFLLLANSLTGYLSYVRKLSESIDKWEAGGIPLTMLMNIERRNGKNKPVIGKALVDLNGNAFNMLKNNRENWAINTEYEYPGAIQYFGPDELCNSIPVSLKLEK
ncbi:MAG: diphosphate--fructose-6-phosphate 1-phosphotransferase [Treponema sp.]|nr:diphosphate--fructose-6-phosphate 1-phosphotransferase [Treponema sp.]